VRAMLVSLGVDPERLTARGLGEVGAAAPTEEAYREHRRVEFVVVAEPKRTARREVGR